MSIGVNLALRNEAQLEAFIAQVSDRKSPNYGRYLTPDQFTATYGPTQAQVQLVVDQLRANGLSVGSVSSNRTIVDASGPLSAVEAAFGVTISDWHDRDQNRDFFGNDTEPTLPSAIASYVVGVAGLDNHYPVHRLAPAPKVGSTGPAGGYTPNELKKAYDVIPLASAGYTGSGQALGLFELDGFRQSNITTYDTQYGLGSPAPSTVLVDGGPGRLGQGEIEVELDIEVMHAIASAAPITVWEGPNTNQGVNDTYNAIVMSNTTKSNSTSWGICEPQTTQAEMTTLDNIFKQGAAQGQSFLAASGDYGAYDCGDSRLTVDSPANDPYITGTGGTALTLNSDGTYKSESAWSNLNTFPATGGGGGLSSYFSRPSWQTGPGVANTNSNGKRQVPDISSDADPNTGYSVYVTNGGTGWTVVGGTSAAAPSWAAFTGVLNQYAVAHEKPNLGFANPTLYGTASSAQLYSPFHDVTTGDNLYYSATTSWDYPTGWGSYDAYNLARDLGCCPPLAYTQAPQGNWTGNYGADGYALLAWNGATDLVALPVGSVVLDQGLRYQWAVGSNDPRAAMSPDTTTRRASCWYHASQLKLHITFSQSYSGAIHLYAVDWDLRGRHEAITVNDGSGPKTANIATTFDQGVWTSTPVSVPAGGSLFITVDNKSGDNAVLSGLFLGDGPASLAPVPTALSASVVSPYQLDIGWMGSSSAAGYRVERSIDGNQNWTAVGTSTMASFSDMRLGPGTTYYYRVKAANAVGTSNPSSVTSGTTTTPTLASTQSPQGNWTGVYGVDGSALLGWNGGTDLISWPKGSVVPDQGYRYQWSAATSDSRALLSPDGTTRRASCWYHATQLKLHVVFNAAYNGTLHIYAVDWDSTGRRESITINDGSGPVTANISSSFNQGAWVTVPVQLASAGSISVIVDAFAGDNAVIGGIFLG